MKNLLATAITAISLGCASPLYAQQINNHESVVNGQRAFDLLSEDTRLLMRYYAALFLIKSCQTDTECESAYDLVWSATDALWDFPNQDTLNAYVNDAIKWNSPRPIVAAAVGNELCLYNSDRDVWQMQTGTSQRPQFVLVLPNQNFASNLDLNPLTPNGFLGDCF